HRTPGRGPDLWLHDVLHERQSAGATRQCRWLRGGRRSDSRRHGRRQGQVHDDDDHEGRHLRLHLRSEGPDGGGWDSGQQDFEDSSQMNGSRTSGSRWRWIGGAVLALAVATACAPIAARRQTDIMEKTGKISVSTAVLRARVNDLVDRFAGKIERTADQIIAETEDDTVHRRALVMKVDAIPAVYAAGFRADPLAAAIDLW